MNCTVKLSGDREREVVKAEYDPNINYPKQNWNGESFWELVAIGVDDGWPTGYLRSTRVFIGPVNNERGKTEAQRKSADCSDCGPVLNDECRKHFLNWTLRSNLGGGYLSWWFPLNKSNESDMSIKISPPLIGDKMWTLFTLLHLVSISGFLWTLWHIFSWGLWVYRIFRLLYTLTQGKLSWGWSGLNVWTSLWKG